MKIVFYSSSTNHFDGSLFHYKDYPSHKENFLKFCKEHPEHEFFIITERPGMFLVDLEGNELKEACENIILLSENQASPENFASFILKQKPDIIISAGFFVTPFDWLSIKDALIGEKLKEFITKAGLNIQLIYQPLKTTKICFDKKFTADFLQNNNFNHASSVYVHHELFWAERNKEELKENIWKEALFYEIQNLSPPLVIKTTTGLSSYGMEVVPTHKAAIGYLQSKKNNSDRLVEEYINGRQFGTEIHGNKESGYTIYPPFEFSVNQYGITSPKQSVKIGPVQNNINFDSLKKELTRLAELLNLNGICQVDLVYEEENKMWYIIEINPRLSGMTMSLGASINKSIFDMLYEASAKKTQADIQYNPVLALKFPILKENELLELSKLPFVEHVSQTVNDAAKQRRECGYCEVILKAQSFEKLKNNLIILNEKFPAIMEKDFFNTALNMMEKQL